MSDLPGRLSQLSREEKAALAQLLRKKKGAPAAPAPAAPPREERREHPLSFAQQRLWFLDRLAPGSPHYNVPGGLRIVSRLEVAVMAASLGEIVRRHAVLRSRFEIRGHGPVQIVEPPDAVLPLPLPVIDLAALPEEIRQAEETRVVRAVHQAPFDLARPPLFRARLLRLGPDEHLLAWACHHIASDAWSVALAVREVGLLYPALRAGRPSPLPELPLQYADFAAEQVRTLQGEPLQREIGFWRERLAGASALELPLDRPRPAVPALRGGELRRPVPAALEAGLERLLPRERATLFMALLAPLAAFFGRLTATEDVVIGTTVAGRHRPDVAGLLGFFVNTLVLRIDLAGDPDGREILARSRQAALDAFAHQTVPFEKLVDELGLPRDPYRPPLLRVLFQLLPDKPTEEDPGFTLIPYRLPGELAKLDLVINVVELDGKHLIDWHFDAGLFDADTIARWAGAFETLLGGWLEHPERRLSELPLLRDEERRALLAPTPVDVPRSALPPLFEAQVDRAPRAPAVSADGGSLTYRDLDERANRLARWLVDAGVAPGDRVALLLDRSPDQVVAILAVLKTGAAYVPLDPSSPRERLAFELEDCAPRVVLDTALLEREAEAIARRPGDRLGLALDPELPAYVIYTSGSTGRPKGVIVPHGAIARLFRATEPWLGFGPDDVWTLFHSYAFDFSVWEIWGALLYGGRLVVVPYRVSRDPGAFLDLLHRERVTVLNQTPSAFRQLGPSLPGLRYILFGGEALDPAILTSWFTQHGDERPQLINLYGITETTVHVTYRPLTREDASRPGSPIGRPIPDLSVHVLDRHLQLQPLGVPGEICVGGAGLAHGYLGRPDLTAARFVPDPFGAPEGRLYRSGDLARRRPDGDLEFLGRIDHQVKVRGFRIELGEIEAAIAAHPAIREVVVARRDGPAAEPRLVAYVSAVPAGAPSFAELREFLAARLSEPMLPSALVLLDRLPLTANGKVDRRALPAPETSPAAASGRAHVPPRDALETSLAELFRQVLNVPAEREIGLLDHFFELGGTSISGAVLINLLQEILGEIVHVVVIFDHPTVEALAAYVREQHAAAAARVWGGAAPAELPVEPPAGPAEVAEMLRLIVEGREREVEEAEEPLNPPAVFLLSPPRSGSTLLRVMLGVHPRLFAPPELELLSFQTLAGRRAAFSGRDSFWLEGAVQAVMEARSCDAAEAERIIVAGEREGWTTRRFYRELQGWIGGRTLVDKTPSYALDPEVLRRAERWFAGARYLHLVRHPKAVLCSFEEARLDQIFFRRPHRFSRRRLAELVWTVSHRHILDFLAEVPAERRHTVRFEELVRDPESVLAGICEFLGLEPDPAMADPYRGGARMTGGVHAVSRMLGDVRFLAHGKVDAAVADRWREAGEISLGGPARAVAAELGIDSARPAWEEGGTAPLTFAQERLWFLEQLLPGTPTYNIPAGLRLRGRLDLPAFLRVCAEIVRRHASLRTVFASEGGQPVQKILPAGSPWLLPLLDLEALPGEERDAEVRRLAAEDSARPFDLETGPLFRALLLRLGPREHVVLYAMHHIVSDGWSMGVFYREVGALYTAFVTGRPSPLPELRLQVPDHALRQRGRLGEDRLVRDLAWWTERLAGLDPLELPMDRPRPPARSGRGAVTLISWRPELSARLVALGRGERATLYMIFLAAFQAFLHRLTQQTDIAVGSPVANRTERDVETLIGFFANTLVMRTDMAGDPTFRELLARVRGTALDALLHQEVPFERVVEAVQPERQLSRTPLFQVLFTIRAAGGGPVELPGLTLEWVEASSVTAKFDLSAMFGESPEEPRALLEYDVDLFDAATAERMGRLLVRLLEAALVAPDTRVSQLPLLDPVEREEILGAWNRTEVPFPREVPIHRLVAEQAGRTPGAVALSSEAGDLTYAGLLAAARRLARRLRRLGAGPEVPVLVLADRSPALVTALLAVLESGSFFVPLEPAAHPRERIATIAATVGARLAVTEERFLDRLPPDVEAVFPRPTSPPRSPSPISHPTPGRGGSPSAPSCEGREEAPLSRLEGWEMGEGSGVRSGGGTLASVSDNLMYVMFTSGSTGEPKGVAVTHRNVARLLGEAGDRRFVDLGPGETFLLLTSVSFDVSALEIWGPLTSGGRLAVFPPHPPSLDELAAFIARQSITQLWLSAGLFHHMAEERPDAFAPLRRLIAGGDALSPVQVRRVLAAHPDLLLVNGYGPTEATIFTTCQVLTPDLVSHTVPIGRPIANTRAYVLEEGLEPAPVGVWGELYAGGDAVARGYFGRPDLTAERFVPNQFVDPTDRTDPTDRSDSPSPGSRLYRTGDLARWRPDGLLEFLGRRDRQVKIRGFRIELGEIEAALAAHPRVREAAVLVRQEGGDKRLVAYVAGEEADADLRSWLAGWLPDFMVPSAFVFLPRLPLTANGKVDRRALDRIAPARSAAGYVAPRTPVEEALAGLFLQVLGDERTGGRVGIHDHFFALGGHSLAAARLVSRARAALGIELPLRALFEAPTVAGLAARCGGRAAEDVPLRKAPRDPAGDPLSFAQERLWVLERLTPGTSTYNLPVRARLRGPLDPGRLARCFAEVCRRHESLRTRFILRAGAPVQVVDPPSPVALPVVDLAGLPEEVRGGEAARRNAEEAELPFDLERGPLLRAVLLRLDPGEHALLLTLHHIITDGWSLGILFRELAVLYEALTAGRPSPLPELAVQVADAARWQRERLAGPVLEAELAWWRERLGGDPEPLDLPLDRVRPGVQTFRGAAVPGLLPADLADRLRALARQEGASFFMVLLAGLDLLLGRLSGQDDLLVGIPVAGRDRPELEDLIGLFLNNLVLRVDLSGGPAGRELLRRAREAALGAYAHQDIPFEKLLQDLQPERDLSRTPLFQVYLNLLNFPDAGARLPDGLVLEPLGTAGVDAKFDLTLYVAEGDEGVGLHLVYNAGLFDRGRMEELLRQLRSVLEQLAAAPDVSADTVSLLTPEATAVLPDPRQSLDDAWIGSVHALFAAQAQRGPDRPAVSDLDGAWTYGELADAVARLAARLRADGLAPGEPVAIWAHRGAPVAWAVMATAWAGGAFVMLDPAYPPARLAGIVELAAPRYWIELMTAGEPPIEVEESLRRRALRGRVRLPGGGPQGARPLRETLPAPVEPAAVGPDDLAYIAFTSGSTGTPKGIEGRHGPLSHFLPFLRERFGLGEEDRYSLLSGLSHDPLQRDLFTPLCLGGSLAAPAAEEIAPGRLAAWMAREGITTAHLTPAMAQLLTEGASGTEIPSLRWVLLVGDVLTRLDVERLRRIAPHVTCVNLYGSTETQRSVAFHVVEERETAGERAPQILPLGRGMRDVQLLVVSRGTGPDGAPRLAGIGEVGEIWMRGPHLARGYLGDAALTADRFRSNPFTGAADDRVYRTGDLGRYRPDGEATFAGRADQQVKIRGFRIELGEIEAALGRLPGVREAVVLARGDGSDRHLVAYVVGEVSDLEPLREALRSRLPAYMVPAAFVRLDRLPVTPNGKVDRRALARIAPERSTEGYLAPRTPTEEALAALWLELLGAERTGGRVGVHDNFFALGGHSLLATRLVVALRDLRGVDLPLQTIFERPSLEEMARAVDAAGRVEALPEPEAPEPHGPVPLSFSQERLWFLDQMAPGTSAYNMAGALRLRGPLDVAALRRSVAGIVRRHDILRTTFAAVQGRPVQRIAPFDPETLAARMPVIDLAALPEEARTAAAHALATAAAERPFDLAAGPLLRVVLLRLGDSEHIALYVMHHIVSDGWSLGVFSREVGLLYEAFAAGRPSPLPELPLQYADYARRQRRRLEGEGMERGLEAWRRILDGVPPLELPADRPRPAVRSWRGSQLPFSLEPRIAAELGALAWSEQATLYMTLLALFQTFLHRLANQDDLAVGTAVANRSERDVEGLIGFFVNSLAMRTDLSGDPPLREAVRRARRIALEAFALQEIPFERIVEALQPERHTSRAPLFQVMLTLQNVPPEETALAGLVLEPVEVLRGSAKLDLSLSLQETDAGLSGWLEHDLDLFDLTTAGRMLRHFATLIEAAVEDPERRISEIPLLAPEERTEILTRWNGVPAAGEPHRRSLPRLFEEQVDRAPGAPAVTLDGATLTYRNLDDRAEALAWHLRNLGVHPGDRVALFFDRSLEMIVALLAVLKTGAAYVPLDPAWPQERLAFALEDSGAALVLTTEAQADALPATTAQSVLVDQEIPAAPRRLGLPLDPELPAYVIYTSGSTGRPKGVVVPHGAVTRLFASTEPWFGFGPGDVWTLFHSYAFDFSVWEIWGALLYGGRLVVVPYWGSREPEAFLDLLRRERVTVLNQTPSAFRQLGEGGQGADFCLRWILFGGEALDPASLTPWFESHGDERPRLVNLYGITETTVHVTFRPLKQADTSRPGSLVGEPIPDLTVHILDRHLEPQPLGVPGEICAGGQGLAQGYLGRPDLTAARFVPDPFGGHGRRLYRSGDLARRRPDGDLEYLGRIDFQVKIRGFRIEPGEIEAALAAHPAVREAAVLVREEGGEKRLVAYVAAEGEDDLPAGLRRWLTGRLPEPMIPSSFVALPRLPLTPNGKTDRRALAQIAPERPSGGGHVAPRTPVEETLAGLFVEVLGAGRTGGRVGVHDSFFELGGHSLLATRLIAAIRDVFAVELPLRTVFERPALEDIARAVEEAERTEDLSGAALPGGGPIPLSFSQERLWFLDQIAPGTAAYNMAGAFRLRGPLDTDALRRAVAEIVRRHGALRTVFSVEEGRPFQQVEPFDPEHPVARTPRLDLSALPEPARDAEARRLAAAEAARPFDLAAGPLFRFLLMRLGSEEHVALYTMHHSVSDGWSLMVFFREVALLYEAFAAGRPSPLPELPLQYADFARRQRGRLEGARMERGLAAWRRLLDGVPPLELPTDRPRPTTRSWRGSTVPVSLGSALSAELGALVRAKRMTLYMALLGLFQTFLHRLSGQDDVAVGTAVANRRERDLEGLIGFFVNSLVMRTDLSGDPPLREALQRARRTALEAFGLQEIPFERVVEALQPERHTLRTPLFQVMLTLQNVPPGEVPAGSLTLEPMEAPRGTTKLDLTLTLLETDAGVSGALEYDLDLFDPATAGRMVRHLVTLIGSAVAEPERRISEIPLLTPEERAEILTRWNGVPASGEPHRRALPRLFEEQVDRAPGAPAVSFEDAILTYRDLDGRAEALAWHLRGLGVLPGDRLALFFDRSLEMIVALLAVLKAGAAYVPLDPAYPEERLAFALEDSGASLVLTSEAQAEALPATAARLVLVDQEIPAAPRRLELALDPELPAYVIYTSGSTGRPKGVVVPHGAVTRLFASTEPWFGFGPDDVWTLFHSYAFDFSVWEIWGALLYGGRLVIAPYWVSREPEAFLDLLRRERVTVLNQTPSAFRQLGTGEQGADFSLRWILFGGEALDPAILTPWLDRHGDERPRLVNLYGITETTVHVTFRPLGRADAARPGSLIGEPIPDLTVHILDRHLEPQPLGVPGEICVGGQGLAQGYLGRPDLTAARFVPDPFEDRTDRTDPSDRSDPLGRRLYRSGDLARRRPDGDLEYLGRIDSQVKIRGFRIELGEIEAALAAHPAVREAAVLVRDQGGEKRLVAYVAAEGADDLPAALRRWLTGRLPEPMIPSAYVVLPRLPLTPNGKTDRRALAQIAPERTAGDDAVAPRTPVEETVAGLFVEVLGTDRTGGRVGVHDNFFELGGHSLLATRLIAAVRDAFQVELPLRLLFERPTVEGLAAALVEAGEAGAPVDEPVLPIPREPGVNRFPVSFSQLREWILDRLEPGNPAYNIPNNLRIGGPLSLPVLTEALRQLVQRHEVFRTAFVAGDDEPLQVVLPEVPLEVPLIDLSALPEDAREAELRRRIRHQAGTGFDLAAAPLLRARVVRLAPDDHALLLTVHHIVSDGWSMGILNGELAVLYEAAAAGAPSPLPPLPVQYADYAVWLRRRLAGETLERQLGFWRQRLAGAPPLLDLPADRPRPPVRSSRGAKVPFLLPRPLADRLHELARRHGATLFMVLLAGYQSLLARWSGQDDVVVGTYSGNRPRKELEGLIGFFINTLALRTGFAGDPSFADLVRRVRETTLGAYAHRDVPFEKLLEILQLPRDPSRTPLFQALLVLQNFPPVRADLSPGVRLALLPGSTEKADYDLALWLGEGPGGLGGSLEHSTDLFDEATVVRFAAHLRTLLEAAVAEPGKSVWELPLTGEEQLAAWSRGSAVSEGPALLHRLVEEQALRTPTAVAVEAGGVRLTYADLIEQAGHQAQRLREKGVGPGTIVALSAERTPDLIVSLLAVLQAGAAYLPVDPAYPQERRAFMLEDSGALLWGAPPEGAPACSPGFQPGVGAATAPPEAPAYVIYTSGSTGRPKGVVVPHRAIAAFVRAARETYEITPGDRVLQLASLSFDTSAEEIWPTLAAGATLVLRPEEMTASIPHFLRELERLGITVLDLPTAFWHELVLGMEAEYLELPRALRLVILGGEEALADRFALWQRRVGPAVRLVNTYGPTETTIVATRRELSGLAPGGAVPIGQPIPGARACVLDRAFAPVPPGVRGELWIGGAGLAQGYLGRPDLTADRFRPDPFFHPTDPSDHPSDRSDPTDRSDAISGARLYRTGDLAVLRPDGDLLFAGRADRQLKIRGYRIEPGEIEAALRSHPAVREAVVDARGPRDLHRLIAWIVPREGSEAPGASDLRAFLRERLPEPLLPAAFVPLPSLPLTPSGKVDRRTLPEPAETRPENVEYAEPQTALERAIAEIYRDILRLRRVGLHDNFFDLGGHSLLVVRAHQRLKEALGKEIPVLDLFRFPTVAALARHLGGGETGNLQRVQSLAEQQRAAQQRQKAAMERLRRAGGPVRKS